MEGDCCPNVLNMEGDWCLPAPTYLGVHVLVLGDEPRLLDGGGIRVWLGAAHHALVPPVPPDADQGADMSAADVVGATSESASGTVGGAYLRAALSHGTGEFLHEWLNLPGDDASGTANLAVLRRLGPYRLRVISAEVVAGASGGSLSPQECVVVKFALDRASAAAAPFLQGSDPSGVALRLPPAGTETSVWLSTQGWGSATFTGSAGVPPPPRPAPAASCTPRRAPQPRAGAPPPLAAFFDAAGPPPLAACFDHETSDTGKPPSYPTHVGGSGEGGARSITDTGAGLEENPPLPPPVSSSSGGGGLPALAASIADAGVGSEEAPPLPPLVSSSGGLPPLAGLPPLPTRGGPTDPCPSGAVSLDDSVELRLHFAPRADRDTDRGRGGEIGVAREGGDTGRGGLPSCIMHHLLSPPLPYYPPSLLYHVSPTSPPPLYRMAPSPFVSCITCCPSPPVPYGSLLFCIMYHLLSLPSCIIPPGRRGRPGGRHWSEWPLGAVESRIRPNRGFGETPGQLFTLKYNLLLLQRGGSPARKFPPG